MPRDLLAGKATARAPRDLLAPAPAPVVTGVTEANAGEAPRPKGKGSFIDSVMDMLSFGTSDEISGLAGGLANLVTGKGDFGKGFQEAKARQLANVEGYAQEHPVLSTVGNVVGSAGALPKAGVAAATKFIPRVVEAAKSGAKFGAAYGAGSTEGGIPERALGAAEGAATVGGLSAGVPIVGKALGLAGKAAALPFKGFKGALNPEKEAARRVVSTLEADAGPGAAERGVTRMEAAQRAQVPIVVGDIGIKPGETVGGHTTRALARDAGRASSEGLEALQTAGADRAAGRAERQAGFVERLVPGGANAQGARDALLQQAEAVRKPAYDKAFAAPEAQSIWNEGLQQLTVSPTFQKAVMAATKRGANEAAVTGTRPPVNPFVRQGDGTLALQKGVRPTLQFWDSVKRNLDNLYSKSKGKEDRRDITRLKDQLVGYLDTAVPDYQQARGLAMSFFKADNALEVGEKLVTWKGNNALARKLLQQMSPTERQLVAEGYASKLAAQLREGGTSKSLLEQPAALQRIGMALGQTSAKRVEAHVRTENLMTLFERAVKNNSPQVRKFLFDAGLSGAGGLAGALYGGGNLTDPSNLGRGAMIAAIILGARRGAIKIDEKVMHRVADMLSSDDPQVLQQAIDVVSRNANLFKALRMGEAVMTRGLTPLAGKVKPLQGLAGQYSRAQGQEDDSLGGQQGPE